MKHLLFIFYVIVLFQNSGCSLVLFNEHHQSVEIILEDRIPWSPYLTSEPWYLLRWNDPYLGIMERFIPGSSYSLVVGVGKGSAIAVCAYPWGKGTPIGGVVSSQERKLLNQPTVILTYEDAAAAEILLAAESFDSGVTASINTRLFSEKMKEAGSGDGWKVQKKVLYNDIVNKNLSIQSFQKEKELSVSLMNVPEGLWLSDTKLRHNLIVHTGGRISISGFYNGVFRYLHADKELQLIISCYNDDAIWYLQNIINN